jgi:hypothetical protein
MDGVWVIKHIADDNEIYSTGYFCISTTKCEIFFSFNDVRRLILYKTKLEAQEKIDQYSLWDSVSIDVTKLVPAKMIVNIEEIK